MTHAEMGSTALWLMLLLGAYHGINPGMGWLFAVALGMQEQKGSAVAKALVPIALGHALSIGCVVLAAALLGMALPQEAIRYSVAALGKSRLLNLEVLPQELNFLGQRHLRPAGPRH